MEQPADPMFRPGLRRSADGVGETIDQGRGRIFPCEQCGADLEFSIGRQSLACPYCGHVVELQIPADQPIQEQDYLPMLDRLAEWKRSGQVDAQHQGESEIRCESCGANVVFAGTLTSTDCPYCDSPLQRDKIHDAPTRVAVTAVLPFAVERTRAHENLRNWVRSLWFAPTEFQRDGVTGKFQGSYLPFFTFDSMTFSRYAGQRGDYYYIVVKQGNTQQTVRKVRWTPAAGQFQRFFDDVVVLGLARANTSLILGLEPWPLDRAMPYNQQVLAGLTARTYDRELPECFEEASRRMEQALYQEARRRIGGDEQTISSFRATHSAVTFKHVLLPVWVLAYRYHGRAYQVFVNAATGKVTGERPYSVWKILFAVLLVLAAIVTFAAITKGMDGGGGPSFQIQFDGNF